MKTKTTEDYENMSFEKLRLFAPARLSIKEAVSILRISEATFHRLYQDGTIPGIFKVGGRTFVDRDRLIGWMEADMT